MVIKMKNKKAQLKIQQMAFMIIAVTLFFVLVGIFVMVIKFSGLKEIASELEERNAMFLVSKLANSPEFSCGNAFGSSRINCIDSDKIMMLKENIAKYGNFWGVSNVEVRKIYPERDKDLICNLVNYPDCNIIRLYDKEVKGYDISNFVSLCRKESYGDDVYDKCELARLLVSYEEK